MDGNKSDAEQSPVLLLKKKRAAFRTATTRLITKIQNTFVTELNDDQYTLENQCEDLLSYSDQLKEKNNSLKEIDDQIFGLLDLEEVENDALASEDYFEKIVTFRGKIERYVKKMVADRNSKQGSIPVTEMRPENVNVEHGSQNQPINPNVNSNDLIGNSDISVKNQQQLFKLPTLVISKFYGDAINWLDFYNQYDNAIHSNDSLSKIEKFTYLKSYLGGSALSAVSGFALTAENYDSALKLLKNRWGRTDLIISAHIKKLLDMQSIKDARDVKSLRKFYDTCEIHIRSLSSLNVTAGSYGTLLCPIILEKIPDEMSLEYNRKRSSRDEFNINELVEYIRNEVECRESAITLTGQSTNYPRGRGRLDQHNPHTVNRKFNFQSSAAAFNTVVPNCLFCNKSHDKYKCDVTLDEKLAKLKKEFRCLKCFNKNHVWRFCRNKTNCKCGSRSHHESICNNVSKQNESETQSSSSISQCHNNIVGSRRVILQTCTAIAKSERETKYIRILLDQGSHRTFISESLAKNLRLKPIKHENLSVFSFGAKTAKQRAYPVVRVELQNKKQSWKKVVQCLVTETISSAPILPPSEKTIHKMKELGMDFADVSVCEGETCDCEILLGADVFWEIVRNERVEITPHLMAINSHFGWLVAGCEFENEVVCSQVSVSNAVVLKDLSRFHDLESLGIIDKSDSLCEHKQLEQFKSNLKFDGNRYTVNLLWKDGAKDMLKSNFEVASERFRRLRLRFLNDLDLFNEYKDVIQGYEREGIIERVKKESEKEGVEFYLPHRAVIRNDRMTSRLRIVFDASSHAKNELSLNDCLHVGPNLYPDILDLLLKFRENPIAITADIRQAFLQLQLDPIDRDVSRFFWINELDQENPIIYRFCRVLFGINCSPFLLAATIKEHIGKYSENLPSTFQTLNENLYVDDLISGRQTVEDAFQTSLECMQIFKDAGMELRKWQSNSKQLRELWEKSNIHVENGNSVNKYLGHGNFPLKVLGLGWNPEKDRLYFDTKNLITVISMPVLTKRHLLRVVGMIFDPIGFLGPFTIRIKMLIQALWKANVDWDETLSSDIGSTWRQLCDDIRELDLLEIPRYYFFETGNKVIDRIELHMFSDASLKAYGTVSYFRIITRDERIVTSFISAKGRVSPVKTTTHELQQTLPRLELMGAVLSARLSKTVLKSFSETICVDKICFWTDSLIVLYWVKSSPLKLKQFVSNRVKEIQELTSEAKWLHVPGKDNPADLISRGIPMSVLRESRLWFHGPDWLSQVEADWPSQELQEVDCHLLEMKKEVTVHECVVESKKRLLDTSRYSSYLKILRIVAWIKRFVSRARGGTCLEENLTAQELEEAEKICLREVQAEFYPSELKSLQQGRSVGRDSSLFTLSPFLDGDGIIRVSSRLDESDYLTYEEKKPALLPNTANLTSLIIRREHERAFHSGVDCTLTRVRRKFWIPKGRQHIKQVIHRCLICRRSAVKPATQLTAPIPRDRLAMTPPFSVVGVDFTGPVFVREGEEKQKAYICLFTCAVTRGVHLELVSSMSTEKFLLAFRRFLARRGNCRIIYSDNAKSFKSAKKELSSFNKIIRDSTIQNFVSSEGITWKFIMELSPWWGGFYERLMKTIKDPLKKILGRALLNFEEMTTVLSEVEIVVNHRPLSYVYSEAGEPEALSPAHFLYPDRNSLEYPAHFVELINNVSSKESLTRRKKYQTVLLNRIWQKWKDNYLLNLRTAHNLTTPVPKAELKVKDVVLLEGQSKSKFLWDLGVIEETFKGRDGLVRSCLVRTPKGSYKRSVQLLYPLEIT